MKRLLFILAPVAGVRCSAGWRSSLGLGRDPRSLPSAFMGKPAASLRRRRSAAGRHGRSFSNADLGKTGEPACC